MGNEPRQHGCVQQLVLARHEHRAPHILEHYLDPVGVIGTPSSVVLQARVDETFARGLLEEDAVVLGLNGPAALVREGLRIQH